jgi:hypothetical protein
MLPNEMVVKTSFRKLATFTGIAWDPEELAFLDLANSNVGGTVAEGETTFFEVERCDVYM